MYSIAARLGSSVPAIEQANSLYPPITDPGLIFPGQLLVVPGGRFGFRYEVYYAASPGDTLFAIAQRFSVGIELLFGMNAQIANPFSHDLLYPGYRLLLPLPASRNILVFRPLPGESIQSGSMIQGLARAFEANVLYTIIDTQGNLVSNEKYITALAAGPEYAEFSANMQFDREPPTPSGELRVYSRSAQDGSVQDLVRVRVTFA